MAFSFARLFFRNAINNDEIADGDMLAVNFADGAVHDKTPGVALHRSATPGVYARALTKKGDFLLM